MNTTTQTTDRADDDRPVRIAYILGTGRSGSTLLDTILGNQADIESVGELCYASQLAWDPDRHCSCGEPFGQCPFWSEVHERWADRVGSDDRRHYARLVCSLEQRRVWLPRLIREANAQSPRFLEYARWTEALYQAIRDVSGKRVLVDTSKRAARAYLLSQIPGLDLRVIHLVRDGRGVVWSMRKRNARLRRQEQESGIRTQSFTWEPWRTTGIWTAGNLQAEWLRRQLPEHRSIRIRYEDYVVDIEQTLSQIGGHLDLDMRSLARSVLAGQPMSTHHNSGGSRLLGAGPVRLGGVDLEWTEKMTRLDRLVCQQMMGRLLQKYGYSRDPRQPPLENQKAA